MAMTRGFFTEDGVVHPLKQSFVSKSIIGTPSGTTGLPKEGIHKTLEKEETGRAVEKGRKIKQSVPKAVEEKKDAEHNIEELKRLHPLKNLKNKNNEELAKLAKIWGYDAVIKARRQEANDDERENELKKQAGEREKTEKLKKENPLTDIRKKNGDEIRKLAEIYGHDAVIAKIREEKAKEDTDKEKQKLLEKEVDVLVKEADIISKGITNEKKEKEDREISEFMKKNSDVLSQSKEADEYAKLLASMGEFSTVSPKTMTGGNSGFKYVFKSNKPLPPLSASPSRRGSILALQAGRKIYGGM